MNKYKATDVVNINGGYVELNEDQARRRAHNLEKLGDGVYGVVNPIQFKVGEVFGYDGEVNKALTQKIVSLTAGLDVSADRLSVEIDDLSDNDEKAHYPVHVGGPWYELSNGEKVQGKQDAEDAEYLLGE